MRSVWDWARLFELVGRTLRGSTRCDAVVRAPDIAETFGSTSVILRVQDPVRDARGSAGLILRQKFSLEEAGLRLDREN